MKLIRYEFNLKKKSQLCNFWRLNQLSDFLIKSQSTEFWLDGFLRLDNDSILAYYEIISYAVEKKLLPTQEKNLTLYPTLKKNKPSDKYLKIPINKDFFYSKSVFNLDTLGFITIYLDRSYLSKSNDSLIITNEQYDLLNFFAFLIKLPDKEFSHLPSLPKNIQFYSLNEKSNDSNSILNNIYNHYLISYNKVKNQLKEKKQLIKWLISEQIKFVIYSNQLYLTSGNKDISFQKSVQKPQIKTTFSSIRLAESIYLCDQILYKKKYNKFPFPQEIDKYQNKNNASKISTLSTALPCFEDSDFFQKEVSLKNKIKYLLFNHSQEFLIYNKILYQFYLLYQKKAISYPHLLRYISYLKFQKTFISEIENNKKTQVSISLQQAIDYLNLCESFSFINISDDQITILSESYLFYDNLIAKKTIQEKKELQKDKPETIIIDTDNQIYLSEKDVSPEIIYFLLFISQIQYSERFYKVQIVFEKVNFAVSHGITLTKCVDFFSKHVSENQLEILISLLKVFYLSLDKVFPTSSLSFLSTSKATFKKSCFLLKKNKIDFYPIEHKDCEYYLFIPNKNQALTAKQLFKELLKK